MSEISAAMQELARLEEKRHQQGLTPEEANHAEQLRAYLDQFQGAEGAAWTGEADPNAQWPQSGEGWEQDPNAQWQPGAEGWQDPNAQWAQQPGDEAWQQDPNAQWQQPSAGGWQDPNAQWQQPGAEGWQQDPNAQWQQQPGDQAWQQDPNAQWQQQPGDEAWQQDPSAQWQQPGGEGWLQDPNAQWQQPGAEGWEQDPNAQWQQPGAEGWQDPNAQWPQQGAEGWQDPNAQWPQQGAEGWQDPNAPWQQPGAEGWPQEQPGGDWPQEADAAAWPQEQPGAQEEPHEAAPAEPPLEAQQPEPSVAAESAAIQPPEPSAETGASPSRPEENLPHWPGYENRPDPSHAWLDDGASGGPSPWVTAPQVPSEPPPPSAAVPEDGALDLGREVDLPGLEATPEWMQSPVPGDPAPSDETSAGPLNLGAFDDPSSEGDAAEPAMEIAPLSAPISTPIPNGDTELSKSLQAASSGDLPSGQEGAAASDSDDAHEEPDDAMEVSDADIIEVSDDDVTLIEDDEEEAAPAAPPPPAPRRPIRIAGGLGPTPAPAPSTIIPRGTPASGSWAAATEAPTGTSGPAAALGTATAPSPSQPSPSERPKTSDAATDSTTAGEASGATSKPSPQALAQDTAADATPGDAAGPLSTPPSEDAHAVAASAGTEPDQLPELDASEVQEEVAEVSDTSAAEPVADAPEASRGDEEGARDALSAQADVSVASEDGGGVSAVATQEVSSETPEERGPVAGGSDVPGGDATAPVSDEEGLEVHAAAADASEVTTTQPVAAVTTDDATGPAEAADAASAQPGTPQQPESDAGDLSAGSGPALTADLPGEGSAATAGDRAGDVVAPATTGGPSGVLGEEVASLTSEPPAPDVASPDPTAPVDAPPPASLEVESPESELEGEASGDPASAIGSAEARTDDTSPAPDDTLGLDAGTAEGSGNMASPSRSGEAHQAPAFGLPGAELVSSPEASGPGSEVAHDAPAAIPLPGVPEETADQETEASAGAVEVAPEQAAAILSGPPADEAAPAQEPADIRDTPAAQPASSASVGTQSSGQPAGQEPAWGPDLEPAASAPSSDGEETRAQPADVPQAVTELADDDDSVPVLDLGDLTLASPIHEAETESGHPPETATDLTSEMFEPLQPEAAAPVASADAPAAEIELAEDPRVLEVIAQPTEIELKEVALGDGVFGDTLELSEQELVEPEPVESAQEAPPAAQEPQVEASSPGGDGAAEGDEVELELELSDVEPEPSPVSDASQSPPGADDDGFDVDLSEPYEEPAAGVYTPSTPPAVVTRFAGQERLSGARHSPLHTERATIPLPGSAPADASTAEEELPEVELELDEPAFEPEEVEAGPSAEVEIELTEADSRAAEAELAEPSMEIELSEEVPAPSAPPLEPTMEIELVEPESLEAPPAAPPAPAPQPVAAPSPAVATEAWVRGEHRVILHTVEGHVLRGTLRDANLLAQEISLELQPGQPPERVPASRAKAVFFMLSSGQPQPTPEGAKIRITFHDGRQVPGYATAHDSGAAGFFVVPVDNRTNTARIFVYRSSIQAISNG